MPPTTLKTPTPKTREGLLATAARYRALAEEARNVNTHDRRFYMLRAERHERLADGCLGAECGGGAALCDRCRAGNVARRLAAAAPHVVAVVDGRVVDPTSPPAAWRDDPTALVVPQTILNPRLRHAVAAQPPIAADLLDRLRAEGHDVAGVVVVIVSEEERLVRYAVAPTYSAARVLESACEILAGVRVKV